MNITLRKEKKKTKKTEKEILRVKTFTEQSAHC